VFNTLTTVFAELQGLPGDGHDRAGARNRPQNNPRGMVNSACKKFLI
jgi:hypothetical protein